MKRDYSAGGIVFNDEGKFLLVRNFKKGKDVDYWGFPKGHLEVGETMKQAALREVKEETGVKAEIIKKATDLKYFFVWEGEKTFKTVTFYLMRYLSGETIAQESEVAGVDWFLPTEAMEKITYENERKVFQEVLNKLDGK